MMRITDRSRVTGTVFGLAYGDALGADTEFMSYDEITARYGPRGPRRLARPLARVTDDTQMTLAVARALNAELVATQGAITPAGLASELASSYVTWSTSPDNDRAPGNACLKGCARLRAGYPWDEAGSVASKGCGANMRVAPIGLLYRRGLFEPANPLGGAAQLSAALTHAHPTALAASELTAYAVAALANGCDPRLLPELLRFHAARRREDYREDWLGDLWKRSGDRSPAAYISRGWDEMTEALDLLDQALDHDPGGHGDPCRYLGGGWVAEEALVLALYCLLARPGKPVAALGYAAATSGDSDSIASITGALAGAAYGMGAWPRRWARRIEYRDELTRVVDWLVG